MEEVFQIENIFIEEDVEDVNYIEYENQEIRSWFNLEEILSFQMEHVVQVVRGEDFQFNCWIDSECYANSLTFLHTLVTGIHQFKKSRIKDNTVYKFKCKKDYLAFIKKWGHSNFWQGDNCYYFTELYPDSNPSYITLDRAIERNLKIEGHDTRTN